MQRAIGVIGGKIGLQDIRPYNCCRFTGIGFLNLDEIGKGLGHRSL